MRDPAPCPVSVHSEISRGTHGGGQRGAKTAAPTPTEPHIMSGFCCAPCYGLKTTNSGLWQRNLSSQVCVRSTVTQTAFPRLLRAHGDSHTQATRQSFPVSQGREL